MLVVMTRVLFVTHAHGARGGPLEEFLLKIQKQEHTREWPHNKVILQGSRRIRSKIISMASKTTSPKVEQIHTWCVYIS